MKTRHMVGMGVGRIREMKERAIDQLSVFVA